MEGFAYTISLGNPITYPYTPYGKSPAQAGDLGGG